MYAMIPILLHLVYSEIESNFIIFKSPVLNPQKKKLSLSVIKSSQVMLYREIIAASSHIHTKHINTAVWAARGIC